MIMMMINKAIVDLFVWGVCGLCGELMINDSAQMQ